MKLTRRGWWVLVYLPLGAAWLWLIIAELDWLLYGAN